MQPVYRDYRNSFEHGKPFCTLMHSHHNLPEIFYYLWHLQVSPRGSFVDLVFRLVLFHQSVEGLAEYPPMVALTRNEKYRFCDKSFYQLLSILMIADSKSYTLLHPRVSSDARTEFLQSQSKLNA